MRFALGLAACLLVAGMPAARVGNGNISFGEAAAEAQGSGLSEAGFQAWLPRLRADAERAGIRQETLDRIFPTLTFSARTIQLDRSQPGGTPGVTPPGGITPYLYCGAWAPADEVSTQASASTTMDAMRYRR